MSVLAVLLLIVGVAVAITVVNVAAAVVQWRSDRADAARRNRR